MSKVKILSSIVLITMGLPVGILAAKEPAAPEPLAIVFEKPKDGSVHSVGAELRVAAAVVNKSDRVVAFPDFGKGKRFSRQFDFDLFISGIPGERVSLSYGVAAGSGGRASKGDFVQLQPNQTTDPREFLVRPMVPGTASIAVSFGNEFTSYQLFHRGFQSGKHVAIPGAWKGSIFKDLKVIVSAEATPEMKKAFKQAEDLINNSSRPMKERLNALDRIAGEKHYFAAGFVRKSWTESTDETIRMAALRHLVSLLDFGTAYEALPDMLSLLKDAGTPLEIRLNILKVVQKTYPFRSLPSIHVASQAIYVLPKEMVETIRTMLPKLAKDKNPKLSALARTILDTKKKPSPKPHPTKKGK